MRKLLIIFLSLTIGSLCFSQTRKIDSLTHFLDSHSENDTLRVNALNILTAEYQNINLAKAIYLAKEAERISEKINYPKGSAYSYYNQGFYYWNKGNYDSALIQCKKALSIFNAINFIEGQINCYTRIAVISERTGSYQDAIEYYFNSISLSEKYNKYELLGRIYNNIGVIYGELNDFNKALEYNYKALEIKKTLKDSFSIGISINNIGHYHLEAGNQKESYKYLNKSLEFNSKIKNSYALGTTYQNLGNLHDLLGNNDSAYVYHQKGIESILQYGSKGQIARSYYLLCNHFLIQEKYEDAINYGLKSKEIAFNTDEKDHLLNCFKYLYQSYAGINNYKKSYEYLLAFKELNEKLKKDENIKKLAFHEKEIEILLQKEKTKLEIDNYKKQRLLTLTALIFSVILILLISYILYLKSKKNTQLKAANETRDKMFKIISHDFRSPLISMSSTLQMIPELISKKDYETAVRLSIKDEQSVAQVLSLIDSLINWTLSQNDNIPYSPENYILYEVSKSIFDIYTPIAAYKKIELLNEISKNLNVFVDKNILNTVLRNLINNAIKFTPSNGKITVHAYEKNNRIEISVIDTGIGIKEDNFEKIFYLNKRKEDGTQGEKGSGLGLFFCKEFVNKNKGEIWVKSELGKGSNFTFTVPRFIS